jgi:transcription antitermination factor NusG
MMATSPSNSGTHTAEGARLYTHSDSTATTFCGFSFAACDGSLVANHRLHCPSPAGTIRKGEMGLRMAEPYSMIASCAGNAVLTGLKAAETLRQMEAPAWYAVQTRPRHEQVVASQLRQEGYEVLLPVVEQVRRWSDRHKVLHVPLFPTYVLIQTVLSDNHERVRVLRKPGVIGFVGPRREATPIASAQIDNVRALMTARVGCQPHPYLTVGQRVRICSGALKGLHGILLRIDNDSNLVLSIDLIHKSVIVRIDGYELEPISQ